MQDKEKAKLWRKAARRPIVADKYALVFADTINGLLVEQIGVLPRSAGDLMKPFVIGIDPEVRASLKPDAPYKAFFTAMRRYTRSAAYLLALAQPDSMRFNIEGDPVEGVSDGDRIHAQRSYLALRARLKQLREDRAKKDLGLAGPATPPPTDRTHQ